MGVDYNLIFILLTSLITVQCYSMVRKDKLMSSPEISLGGWMESDFDAHGVWNTNTTPPVTYPYSDAILVPSSIRGLSLICNASYPVEWRFHRETWGGRSRIQYALQTTRHSDGLDPIGFTSELSFFGFDNNGVTGNYTCQKVGNPWISDSLYVFWEGGSPPFLTLARAFRKTPTVPFRNDSVSFKLPCTVAIPSVEPQLTKEVGKTEEIIRKNGSVKWDPREGFTLTNLPNPYGRYTCKAGDEDDEFNEGDADEITFTVVNADDGPKPEFNETLRHGAYYYMNSTSREITCCTNHQKPPKLKLVECVHPTICALSKHTLHTMESAKKRKDSCSTVSMRTLRAGVFRCVGAGIDVVREYFYPMPEVMMGPWGRGGGGKRGGGKGGRGGPGGPGGGGGGHGNKNKDNPDGNGDNNNDSNDKDKDNNPPAIPRTNVTVEDPFFDWNEADEKKMMMVTKLKSPLYIGENRTFSCRVSHFYYAQGLVWGITFSNQSIVYLNGREPQKDHRRRHWPGAGIRHFDILLGKNQQMLDLIIDKDLQNVTCYAPIWNSTEWGKKSITFDGVKQPTAPQLLGGGITSKSYSWYLNDTKKSLKCEFSGEPMPKVLWQKGNATFALNTNTDGNGSSEVTFPVVSIETEDVYTCIISNVAGTVTKTFRVTVLHSASSAMSAILVFSIIGFILISIVAGVMFKYLKSQKTVINQLANLAFKDVTGNNQNNPTNRAPVSVETNGVILPPSSSSTTSTLTFPSQTVPSSKLTGGGGGNTNNGFIFDYSTPITSNPTTNSSSADLQHQQPLSYNEREITTASRPSSPQPPLSSFSSYHKF